MAPKPDGLSGGSAGHVQPEPCTIRYRAEPPTVRCGARRAHHSPARSPFDCNKRIFSLIHFLTVWEADITLAEDLGDRGRTMSGPGAVYVVAANRLLRDSVVRLLKGKGDLRVCGADHFTPSTVVQIRNLKPSVVVLSPGWGDVTFQSTRAIHKTTPDARVLMIEMEDEEAIFLRAVQAGATGYLLKDATAREMVEAVRRLAQDLVVCPEHLERALFRFVMEIGAARPSTAEDLRQQLTPREQKLLSLLFQGLTNKEIGTQLNLSECTVKNHVHRILRKTGTSNRMALAQFATRHPAGIEESGRFS
jgi:two-component system, NarL family, response regulator DevR